MIVEGLHPAFVLILGSLLLAFVRSHRIRQIILIALPVLSLINVLGIKAGTEFAHGEFMGIETIPIHAEKLNLLFVLLFFRKANYAIQKLFFKPIWLNKLDEKARMFCPSSVRAILT